MMPDVVTILILFVIAEVARSLPRIIWSLRCPADSPNYVVPPDPARLFHRRR
jgi:hypothetical protein